MYNVFVGVSGGIDSAASLLMLKEKGYNVTGVFLLMRGEKVPDDTLSQLKELSVRIGVEIIIHNVRDKFEQKIVKPFIESYVAGLTPSPCAECNPLIKWQSLLEVADSRGGGYVATGHYCRVEVSGGNYYLAKGKDLLKDQSYYMWQLPQEVLNRAIFPLGEMTKTEVREFMKTKGWIQLTQKPESMGVCFLEGKNYVKWLKENSSECANISQGEVVDRSGKIVATHSGYPFYTLAQRKGLAIEKGLCVVAIDISKNRLVVGSNSELMSRSFALQRCCFVDVNEMICSEKLEVKVRGVGVNPSGYCRVVMEGESRCRVELLDDNAWAVTQGQPAVFYIENRVVGGGIVVGTF